MPTPFLPAIRLASARAWKGITGLPLTSNGIPSTKSDREVFNFIGGVLRVDTHARRNKTGGRFEGF